jgi:hypothetical protein
MDTLPPAAPSPDAPAPDAPGLDLTPPSGDPPPPPSPETDIEQAAATKPAVRKAGPRTAAKAPKSASARAGARPRRLTPDARPVPPKPTIHLIMLTSRVSDEAGKSVARRRLAVATEGRAEDLILRGQARLATAEEVSAHTGPTPPTIR